VPDRAARASGSDAVSGTAAKACKQRKGESRKHWQKRCKCAKPKRGESRKRFKKRCPARKKPGTTAPGTTAPGTTPPATGPLTGQAAIDKFTQGLIGTQLQYFTYSQTSGSSEDERYVFCNGSFSYKRNRVGLSGAAYDTNATGNWRITSATVNADQITGSAVLHYDLTGFNSNDVDPAPPASGDVPISFNGVKVNFAGRNYDPTKVAC
jgi:hypothetical protein